MWPDSCRYPTTFKCAPALLIFVCVCSVRTIIQASILPHSATATGALRFCSSREADSLFHFTDSFQFKNNKYGLYFIENRQKMFFFDLLVPEASQTVHGSNVIPATPVNHQLHMHYPIGIVAKSLSRRFVRTSSLHQLSWLHGLTEKSSTSYLPW